LLGGAGGEKRAMSEIIRQSILERFTGVRPFSFRKKK
jgi:hypothetical protein